MDPSKVVYCLHKERGSGQTCILERCNPILVYGNIVCREAGAGAFSSFLAYTVYVQL